MLREISKRSFFEALKTSDPGYALVNWSVAQVGADVWLVNLICGAIFTWGLIRFARIQERPWLAVLIAVPYLVTVVAMGYTRQSVSIGLVMAGFASYSKHGSSVRFALYVLAAATFHKSAVIALPLVALGDHRSIVISSILTAAMTYLFFTYFLSSSMELLVENYIDTRYSSQGAGIRVAMTTIPALLYILRARTLGLSDRERRIWRNMSLAALGLVPALFIVPSSTAVDRIALYLLPIQMVVLSRPRVIGHGNLAIAVVIAYSALVLIVWLNFAVHARLWIPYRLWPMY